MTPGIKPLIAGNWKMNGLSSDLEQLRDMAAGHAGALAGVCDMLVCVPATLLFRSSVTLNGTTIRTGGQDCHPVPSGAHTGDISVAMLADAGATSVIVGHSERRSDHGESDVIVHAKARAGLAGGMQTIVCIGETEAERRAGNTLDVLGRQLAGSVPEDWYSGELVIAYEPVWAIGTGLTPTIDDVREAHSFMRAELASRFGNAANGVRLLYGGSVKPSNAAELLAVENVDGALVGGASLKATDFLGIAQACLETG